VTPPLVRSKDFSALPPAKIRFIEPMYARLVNELPEGRDWLYEVKFDGYRCLAGRDSTGATLWSREETSSQSSSSTSARACERIPFPLWTIATGERNMVQFTLTR